MRTHHLKPTQHLTGHQNTTDSFQSPAAVQQRESGLAVTPATYPRVCNTATNRIKNTAGYHGASSSLEKYLLEITCIFSKGIHPQINGNLFLLL